MVEENDITPTNIPGREFEDRQFTIKNCPLTVNATTHKDGIASFEIHSQGIHESHINPTSIIITGTMWMKEQEMEMFMETLEAAMAWAKKGFVPPKRKKK